MSRADAERAVLGLYHRLEPDVVVLGDLLEPDSVPGVAALTVSEALRLVAVSTEPSDPVDRFWMARSLVDVVRRGGGSDGQQRDVNPVDAALEELAVGLLSPYDLPDPDGSATALVEAVRLLQPKVPLSNDALVALRRAFGGALEIAGTAEDPQVLLSGNAADLATMVLEMATNDLTCDTSIHMVDVHGDGTPVPVVFVEVDCCTNRLFDDCKGSIDPLQWPAANPFFISVTLQGPKRQTSGPSWTGTIREVVGPGLNGKVYTTDLDVSYVEQAQMALTTFEIAAHRKDPGLVTVDRGFLALTDEGIHRRLRILKVYRIEDLNTPPSWICPLWSSQLVLSAWWAA